MSNTLQFNPREWQKNLFNNPTRFAVWIIHRRAGKTYAAIMKMVIAAIVNTNPRPQYAYLLPEGDQAERVTMPYFIDFLKDFEGVHINHQKKIITLAHNGAKIFLLGLKEPDRLRGLYLDGVVIDEFGDVNSAAWGEVVFPTLTDRKGWAIITGTPKGQDGLYEMYCLARDMAIKHPASWSVRLLDVFTTGVFSTKEISEMQELMTEAQFRQEFLLDFNADFNNRYFAELLDRADKDNRVASFGYNPKLPVHVSFDFGSDGTALWFCQKENNKLFMIDYFEKVGLKELSEIFNLLTNKGYTYGYMLLPHDATQTTIRGDASIITQFKAMGYKVHLLKRTDKNAGIRVAQSNIVRCHFDAQRCKRGLECLNNYQARID